MYLEDWSTTGGLEAKEKEDLSLSTSNQEGIQGVGVENEMSSNAGSPSRSFEGMKVYEVIGTPSQTQGTGPDEVQQTAYGVRPQAMEGMTAAFSALPFAAAFHASVHLITAGLPAGFQIDFQLDFQLLFSWYNVTFVPVPSAALYEVSVAAVWVWFVGPVYVLCLVAAADGASTVM
ncbi:unnamed protein product, partial [Ilex paraguariensis]